MLKYKSDFYCFTFRIRVYIIGLHARECTCVIIILRSIRDVILLGPVLNKTHRLFSWSVLRDEYADGSAIYLSLFILDGYEENNGLGF